MTSTRNWAASEYLPYCRKDKARVAAYLPERWDYYEICSRHDDEQQTSILLERLKADLKPSLEYGASIIHSLETGVPRVVYGNFPNRGLISNLPDDYCVKVPCLVDKNGTTAFLTSKPVTALPRLVRSSDATRAVHSFQGHWLGR